MGLKWSEARGTACRSLPSRLVLEFWLKRQTTGRRKKIAKDGTPKSCHGKEMQSSASGFLPLLSTRLRECENNCALITEWLATWEAFKTLQQSSMEANLYEMKTWHQNIGVEFVVHVCTVRQVTTRRFDNPKEDRLQYEPSDSHTMSCHMCRASRA